MVFDTDSKWRDMFRASHWRRYTRDDSYASRFRSMGTEELLVRCIRAFMPFVDTIYILLARESQKQPWMDRYGIRVVYHDQFIPPAYLPTFNSRLIEMFLNRIPDLSEHFIYGNDDMFPVSPMKEEDFFVGGRPCQHLELMELPEDYSQFAWVCKEGTKLIAASFGEEVSDDRWLSIGHGVSPLLRSACDAVWERYRDTLKASLTQKRDWKNYNQYIYVYYQHYAGLAVDKERHNSYTDNTCANDEVRKAIMNAKGVVCVNDAVPAAGFDGFASMVSEVIGKRLVTYLEKTNNYGKRTESRTAGTGGADAAPLPDEQRRDGGDNTPHEEEVQDTVAEKRPADQADQAPAPQDRRGKGKNNGKRGFRFDTRG